MAMRELEGEASLVRLCIEAACRSRDAVERWRRQYRTLERLPSPLAEALLHRLLRRRIIFPSLLELFKFSVEQVDLGGESLVDAEWMAYLGAFHILRSLNLSNCYRITNSAIWPITGLASLKELDLSHCSKVNNSGIIHLVSLWNLEKLCISGTGVTADGVKLVSSLRNLSMLDLGGLPVSDIALSSLKVLKKLEYLDVWGSRISDKGAAILVEFRRLSFLNLAWTKVTKLPNLKSLASLNMSNCIIQSVIEVHGDSTPLRKLIVHGASLRDAGEFFSYIDPTSLSFLDISNTDFDRFGFLQCMHSLEHLDLSFSMITDDSMEMIACIGANLRHLNLNNTKISLVGIEILSGHVPHLEVISLSCTPIDDAVIAYISLMPSLEAVDLSNTLIKGFTHLQGDDQDESLSLAMLQNLRHLKRLDLSGTYVTDAALHPLSSFHALSHLSLMNASLTDACLPHLSSMKKLVELTIRDALLTDNALHSFNPPATAKILDIRGCWLLTGDALKIFCGNHPELEVRHELLEVSSANTKLPYVYSPLSQATSQVSKSKQRLKQPVSSSIFREEVVDQRIKYSREELIALQAASSSSTPDNICTAITQNPPSLMTVHTVLGDMAFGK
ncbi:hypothetical protein Dimus_027348 [Dionaea muscipula]